MISTRSVELVIDTVVCLTLAKWETVSGQFGGYLNRAETTLSANRPNYFMLKDIRCAACRMPPLLVAETPGPVAVPGQIAASGDVLGWWRQ